MPLHELADGGRLEQVEDIGQVFGRKTTGDFLVRVARIQRGARCVLGCQLGRVQL